MFGTLHITLHNTRLRLIEEVNNAYNAHIITEMKD